jgi:Mobilization protein NikA
MDDAHTGGGRELVGSRVRRRARQTVKRPRTVRFDLTEDEYGELGAAAERAGLAKGAFAAEAALAAARGTETPRDGPFREALAELVRSAGLVRRIGVNLNQAVARLNATGQRSGDLLPYAAESLRRAERLDAAAEQLRRRLR